MIGKNTTIYGIEIIIHLIFLGWMKHQLNIDECAGFVYWPHRIKKLFIKFCISQHHHNSEIISNCKTLFNEIRRVRLEIKKK